MFFCYLTICQLFNISHPYLVVGGVCGQFISNYFQFKILYLLFLQFTTTFSGLTILSLKQCIIFVIDPSLQISSYCYILHAAVQVLFRILEMYSGSFLLVVSNQMSVSAFYCKCQTVQFHDSLLCLLVIQGVCLVPSLYGLLTSAVESVLASSLMPSINFLSSIRLPKIVVLNSIT